MMVMTTMTTLMIMMTTMMTKMTMVIMMTTMMCGGVRGWQAKTCVYEQFFGALH